MNPHDMPSAQQLVESVREWLERDVMAQTTGRLQFHTRVTREVKVRAPAAAEEGDGMAEAGLPMTWRNR